MKRLIVLIAVTVSVISCRRGPEDPCISFKNRKARMVNTWKATKYYVNGFDSLRGYVIYKDTTQPIFGCVGNIEHYISKSIFMKFESNGLYELIKMYSDTVHINWGLNLDCPDTTYFFSENIYNQKGLWTFGGGSNGYKNKELLELSDSLSGTVTGKSYEIIELRSGELKLKGTVNGDVHEYTFIPSKEEP